MSQTHITDLPCEMLQNLAGYLDFDDIANVRKNSSYIDNCLSGDYFWKTFAQSHISSTFPPYEPDISKFDWETSVTKYIKERKYWDMSTVNIKISEPPRLQNTTVTAIMITKDGKYCVTSEFLRMALWDVRTLFNNPCRPPVACKRTNFTGSIRNFHQNDANIYSVTFDKTVKIWDLDTNLTFIKTMNIEEPAYSVTTLDTNTVCMGLENGALAFADSRVPETYEQVRVHNMPVVSIVASDNTTISCSEDYNISIVDRRRPRPNLRQVPYLPSFGSPSLCDYYLLVGSYNGDVHFYDADSFAHKGQHKVANGDGCAIVGLYHNMGSIVVATGNGRIKHYTLTNPPELKRSTNIYKFPLGLHYSNQVIAVVTEAGAVLMTHAENELISI